MIDFLDQSQMWAPGNYSGLSLIKRSTRETYQEITDVLFIFVIEEIRVRLVRGDQNSIEVHF